MAVISASRRTDIPMFYAEWMMNRLRAGWCTVPNPFNKRRVSRVSLQREDVEAIVFWTRNPRPLMPFLAELDDLVRGRYYFQYTITGNDREMDPGSPPMKVAVSTFQELSEKLRDPRRAIWRYDPIVLAARSTVESHVEKFCNLARELRGYTRRCVVSVVDHYGKASKRLERLGVSAADCQPAPEVLQRLFTCLRDVAQENGMEIFSCAEKLDLEARGIPRGKCIDGALMSRLFDIQTSSRKDPGQREACGCIESRDIGMYDSCLFGCQYCYATKSFEVARQHHQEHDPCSPSLLGHHEASTPARRSPERR